MNVRTCLLAVALVGSSGLAGGGIDFQTVAAGSAGGAYAVFSEAGSAEYGTQKLRIAVYQKKGGKLLWKRQIGGRLYQSSSATRNFPGWGIAGPALWVTRTTSGAHWTADNLGFRLSDGQPLWDNVDVGHPLAVAAGRLLFKRTYSHLPRPDLRQVALIVNDLATGAERRLNLHLPERAGCGDPNAYSYEDAEYLKRWADARFFYAQHKDACGLFVARFDWHGTAGQLPHFTPR